jgi:hypothetical protein
MPTAKTLAAAARGEGGSIAEAEQQQRPSYSGTRAVAPVPPSPSRIKILSYEPRLSGALRAVLAVEMPFGLVLRDVPLFVAASGPWVGLPSKPVLNRDGMAKLDANGKRQYAPIAEWRNRDLASRWSTAVLAALREAGLFVGGTP